MLMYVWNCTCLWMFGIVHAYACLELYMLMYVWNSTCLCMFMYMPPCISELMVWLCLDVC